MKTILGIGECMIELSSAGPALWRQGFAGDVFNTLWYARASAPEDWRIAFHTGLGTDPISNDMAKFFEEAGVPCDSSVRVPDRLPGLYAIHLSDGERSFSYWRDRSAARLMMSEPDGLWAKVAKADLVYFSGITVAILAEADADALLAGLARHKKPGACIAFDPNIRPRLWDKADRMRAMTHAAASVCDIVLPSFDDEAACFGDATSAATAARYRGLGVPQVVVKDGLRPTSVSTSDGVQQFPVTPVGKIVDTTAAGDSFNGAYLVEYLASGDTGKAVLAAQACSAKVVGAAGALVPFDAL